MTDPEKELLYLRLRISKLESDLTLLRYVMRGATEKIARQRRQMVMLAKANQQLNRQLAAQQPPADKH